MRNILIILLSLQINQAIAQSKPALMPWPQAIKSNNERFNINKSFSVAVVTTTGDAADLKAYAVRFLDRLAASTGIFIENHDVNISSTADLQINIKEVAKISLGIDESYQLSITTSGIALNAQTDIGAMRGLETLLQLLASDGKEYYFKGYTIKDYPRFAWRGLLLDVCRHWMPMDVVLRNIDGMAAVKMNVLHLHLTEDQGFRVESKVFPKLHLLGSDGNYFTQEEIKYIVAYAAARGIRVVPEFDIPGHATSWFVGYPELASAPGPYELNRNFGVHNPTMDPTKASTYNFLDKFLGEMATLFPDAYMHIGGDENNGKQWDANPEITKFKEENNLASIHELQAYFNTKISAILTKYHKRMVGWDEIADEDLPKSIVIQSWRGKQALVDAAEAGYDVLLSNGYYIDLVQPASYHYLNDPIPADIALSSEAERHILGGEATMWTELVSPETVDSRIWPRTAAIAERFWSPQKINNVQNMYHRLPQVSRQLESVGLMHIKNQEMMMRRLLHQQDVTALKTLVNVLEPIEGYKRHQAGKKYTTYSPLTRIPDIAQPDAFAARHFNNLVDQYFSNHDAVLKDEIKSQLLLWIDNHKKLKVLATNNPQVRDILPLSDDLSGLAVLAMQGLSTKIIHDDAWIRSAEKMLQDAAKPKVECEIKVIEGIAKIVAKAK